MFSRFAGWLQQHLSPLQAASLVMFCLLVAGAFALGALLGNVRPPGGAPVTYPEADAEPVPVEGWGRKLGRYAAIERIEGERIQLRDPRSGHIWVIRANPNTIVEFGPRHRIPINALRPGLRVFVVGVQNTPAWNEPETDLEWNAQFIGVVGGQPQRYLVPAPRGCEECVD